MAASLIPYCHCQAHHLGLDCGPPPAGCCVDSLCAMVRLFVELGIGVLGNSHPPEILGIVDALVVLEGFLWAGGVSEDGGKGYQ